MDKLTTMVMDQAKIGRFIAELRREKNLTQAQLGELLGVSHKTVSRWECGNYMPDLAVIPQLAAELGITVNELFAAQRFAAENYKREADRQLLQTLQLVEEVRKARDYRQVARCLLEIGFVLITSVISYNLLNPQMERPGGMAIYTMFLVLFGAVGWYLPDNGWLKRNAGGLLRAGLNFLLLNVCWYALARQDYIVLPILLIGFFLLWLGSLGDNLYYKIVDELLKKADKPQKNSEKNS